MSERTNQRQDMQPCLLRLFIVCSKLLTENELQEAFNPFGVIKHLYMPRERTTGNSKGVAYITYSRVSHAALALEKMNGKHLGSDNKKLRVLIAEDKDSRTDVSEENYKRLFVICSKTETQEDLKQYFSTFGSVEKVVLLKDKTTDTSKGLAYICFEHFSGAAQAFDECDSKYKAVFAKPRENLKRNRHECNTFVDSDIFRTKDFENSRSLNSSRNYREMLRTSDSLRVVVTCNSKLTQEHIENIFNIIPGMRDCEYTVDNTSGFGKAVVTYDTCEAAAHAVDRINNLEYPLGDKLVVRPDSLLNKVAKDLNTIVENVKDAMTSGTVTQDLIQLVSAMSQASNIIKCATTSRIDNNDRIANTASLPRRQPLALKSSSVAKSCFFVCHPCILSLDVLQDLFCRVGDLIEVLIIPNKTWGFVKYASTQAANDAVKVFNGTKIGQVTVTVKENKEIEKGDSESNDGSHKRLRTDIR